MAPKFDPFKAKPLPLDGDNPLLNKGAPLPDIKPSPAAPTPKTNTADIDILDSAGIVGGYYDCDINLVDHWTKLIDINAVPRKSQPLTLTIDMQYMNNAIISGKSAGGIFDYCVKIVYGNEFSEHTIYVDIRNGESISLVAAHMKVYFAMSTFGIPKGHIPNPIFEPQGIPAQTDLILLPGGTVTPLKIGAFVSKGAYGTGRPTRTNIFWHQFPVGLAGAIGGLCSQIPELARTVTVCGRGTQDREVVFISEVSSAIPSRISGHYIAAGQEPPKLIIPGGAGWVVLRQVSDAGAVAPAVNGVQPVGALGSNPYRTFAIFELGL